MESTKYIYVCNILKGYATDLMYTGPVFDSMNAMFTPMVDDVTAKSRFDVLTPESRLHKIPAKFSGNSKIRKLHFLTKHFKEARATFQKQNEEAMRQNEEAWKACLEIEKAHTRIFKKAVKVQDAPKNVDFRYNAIVKNAIAGKMFRRA
jgi:hypothetical protein